MSLPVMLRSVPSIVTGIILWISVLDLAVINGFVVVPSVSSSLLYQRHSFVNGMTSSSRSLTLHHLQATKSNNEEDESTMMPLPDEELLQTIDKSMLLDLCEQLNIEATAESSKPDMLAALRNYAATEADKAQQQILERKKRVEGYDGTTREKYEVIPTTDEQLEQEADEEGYFFFELPTSEEEKEREKIKATKRANARAAVTTPNVITAPPTPITTNERGERVATVYSTSETNDMTQASTVMDNKAGASLLNAETSIPSTTNTKESDDAVMTADSVGGTMASLTPDDVKHQRKSTTPKEIELAKKKVQKLVTQLLLSSGGPGFRQDFEEQEDENEEEYLVDVPKEFVGFDPSRVPAEALLDSSPALRTGRGSVLTEVLNDFELRAIGHDGMAGDDVDKGGGHYKQIALVRAFLQGFRKAEVRRITRETTTMLLDKIATEGIQGLDGMLSTMIKSDDDSANAGELSDSLVEYLADAVREQEARVGELKIVDVETTSTNDEENDEEENDEMSELWEVSSQDGERVETFDPNNPAVKRILEANKVGAESKHPQKVGPLVPTSAPEKLLLLLRLLRDRVKAEAAYQGDLEKARNLKTLAYCLRFNNENDREKLVRREFGGNVDRLDEFIEFVSSSIDYATSASFQLQPGQASLLSNTSTLESVLNVSKSIRNEKPSTTLAP